MHRWSLLLGLPVGLLACGPSPQEQFAARYDEASGQPRIETKAGVDAVLAELPRVPYRKLPKAYLQATEQDTAPFARKLRGKRYYRVEGTDRHRFLAGRFRIDAFLPHDDTWRRNSNTYEAAAPQFLLLDPRVPKHIVTLQNSLRAAGHDPDGFSVREAFRDPKLNRDDGGASRSRHIYGQAVDLVIGDINRDGASDKEDKAIVLELLERQIGNKGGIGRYPGTQTVHFDVRGRRARWDAY